MSGGSSGGGGGGGSSGGSSKDKSSKSSKKRRKHGHHHKSSKQVQFSRAELVRRLRLLLLTCGAKCPKDRARAAGIAVLALFVLQLLFTALLGAGSGAHAGTLRGAGAGEGGAAGGDGGGAGVEGGSAAASLADGAAALSPLERIHLAVGGVGAPHADEAALVSAAGVAVVSLRAGDGRGVLRELARLELAMNRGWNTSEPKVLPLGQYGYVKRDLPVYKDAFLREDMTVLSRPKSGLYSVEQLRSPATAYNIILCLSFNTDHCFDPSEFVSIGKTRKVNRIQALRDTVWSKHKFCRTISGATAGVTDRDLLSFTFPCWVMPMDYDAMLAYARKNDVETWIAKPRSLGAGMGIYVVSSLAALEHERQTQNVVQTYMEDPHLLEKPGLDGKTGRFKWDMRTYVLCTSVHPVRAYVYTRGLVRISTAPYSTDCSKNITACLTNTSLNKKAEGAQLKDITWSLKKLADYLAQTGEPDFFKVVFPRMQRAIGMALLSAETEFLRHLEPQDFKCENCYQLLGVDLLFDGSLEPKVVEINGEPNLKLTGNGKTHYDFTKRGMARDLVSLVYNRKEPLAPKLAPRLARWAAHVAQGQDQDQDQDQDQGGSKAKGKPAPVPVGQDHLEYMLATFREHAKLGGFRPVYPNAALAEPYSRYLAIQRDKEAKKKNTKKLLAHADGRRHRLHQLITLMQSAPAIDELRVPLGGAVAAEGAGGNAEVALGRGPAVTEAKAGARKKKKSSDAVVPDDDDDDNDDLF